MELCVLMFFLVWVLLVAVMFAYPIFKFVRFLNRKERKEN